MTDATTIRAPAVSGDGLEAFAAGLHGRVIGPGAPGYDEGRAIWNGMIDRRPAVIVRCAETTSCGRCISRASTTCWSRPAAAATTSPAPRCAMAAS